MTEQAYFELFSEAMKTKRIIRYENDTSRDDYHTYAIRETSAGHVFFCLLETFFRRDKNTDSWIPGSLKAYHEFGHIAGATSASLVLTNEHFDLLPDYRDRLPVQEGAGFWQTID
jgi:adenosine/AMP kinase